MLSTICHKRSDGIYYFLVVQTLESVTVGSSAVDDILGLPFFCFSGKWIILPLEFADPSPVYFIDPNSSDGTPHPESAYLVLCSWHIDYV